MQTEFVSVGEQLKQELANKSFDGGPAVQFLEDKPAPAAPAPRAAPAPAPEPEPVVEEAPAPAPQPDRLADFEKRLAKLQNVGLKTQQEREALKAERDAFRAEQEEFRKFQEIRARAKEDPVAWAELGGFKPDEYATTLVEKGSFSPERKRLIEQQQKINELEQWRQEQVAAQQKAAADAQMAQVVREMSQFEPEKFDLVHRTNSYQEVMAEYQRHWEATAAASEDGEGEMLTPEEAFSRVESRLEKQYAPLLESPKFRSKLGQGVGAETSAATSQQPAARKSPGTITNKLKASSAAPRQMTEAERLQKAGELLLAQMYGRR